VQASIEAVLAAVRRDDPQGWAVVEGIRDVLPGWADELDATGEVPDALWDALPVGVLNRVGMPQRWGGVPLLATAVQRAAVFELIGRICPAFALVLPGPALAMPAVARLGTQEQQRDYFARFHRNDRPWWGGFAITEPSGGSNAAAMTTTARRVGDRYVINGHKCFIGNGDRAQTTVLFATVDPGRGAFGVRAFVVDAGTPGFRVERSEDMMGLRASHLAALRFEDCEIPADRMLGGDGAGAGRVNGFVGANTSWDYMRPGLAALVNGACVNVLDVARGLVGSPDGEVPLRRSDGVREELRGWRTRVEASRLLALRAAWLYDRGATGGSAASSAKCWAATTAVELANWLGATLPVAASGAGPVGRFCRDARAFDILEGTGDIQRMIISRTHRPGRADEAAPAAGGWRAR
jgi:acyl-CoA dehydrogenase